MEFGMRLKISSSRLSQKQKLGLERTFNKSETYETKIENDMVNPP